MSPKGQIPTSVAVGHSAGLSPLAQVPAKGACPLDRGPFLSNEHLSFGASDINIPKLTGIGTFPRSMPGAG
jgi:hypothetical protein